MNCARTWVSLFLATIMVGIWSNIPRLWTSYLSWRLCMINKHTFHAVMSEVKLVLPGRWPKVPECRKQKCFNISWWNLNEKYTNRMKNMKLRTRLYVFYTTLFTDIGTYTQQRISASNSAVCRNIYFWIVLVTMCAINTNQPLSISSWRTRYRCEDSQS